MDEITEEPAALAERVAALDIWKATLTVCARVPHDDKPGARRQEVRTYATLSPALLELRDWLICQGVTDLLFPLRRETNIGDRKLGSVMPLLTQRDWSSTWAKRTLPPIPDPNSQKRTAPGHSWPGPAGHRFVEGRYNVEAAGVEPTPHVGVGQEPAP